MDELSKISPNTEIMVADIMGLIGREMENGDEPIILMVWMIILQYQILVILISQEI